MPFTSATLPASPHQMSAGSIALHVLATSGSARFGDIIGSRLAKSAGAHLSENSYYTALARLRRRGMIDKDGYAYALTPKGEWAAMKAHVSRGMSVANEYKGNWDGKWRIVLFDFPESQRQHRDYVRRVLVQHGFRQFQRSMWIWPYRIPEYLRRLFSDPRLSKHVRYVTTQDINYDADLRRRFKLT